MFIPRNSKFPAISSILKNSIFTAKQRDYREKCIEERTIVGKCDDVVSFSKFPQLQMA